MTAALLLAAALAAPGPAADSGAAPFYYSFTPDEEARANAALSGPERDRLRQLLAERNRLDGTVWRNELAAQAHETVIDEFWDRLRRAKDPFAVARAFPAGTLRLPAFGPARELKDGLRLASPTGAAGPVLDPAAWRSRLERWKTDGWSVDSTEWHHAEFHPESTPPWSVVTVSLHLLARDGSRHVIRGKLKVTWREPARPGDLPAIASVDASDLSWLWRAGPAPFRKVLDVPFERRAGAGSSMLLAWDLAGSGRSDLVLPGVNVRFRNRGDGTYARERFLAHPVEPDACGVFGDFDGDGVTDYLCVAGTPQRLLLYRGKPGGDFPDPPVAACPDALDLRAASVIGVGDVRGTGRLDVWIGQYRNPYFGGEFPNPYYDANDGYPCYLLFNDGHGRFRDGTAGSGFEAKRNRRNYCAVFLDLDGDGRPDLVTINDFAGVDVWRNLGGGRFADVTGAAVDDPMNFGMGIAVDDFARDGHLGFYVSGMGSTTMRRLAAMGLARPDLTEITATRTRMGYGSRMYLWTAPGAYRQPAWNDQICRSGWSWGTVGFDPDLDGDRDLFVANGFISGRSSQDYCTTFWRHDIYTPASESTRMVRHLLASSTGDLNRGAISWNGFEKKKLFLRVSATEWVEAAHPFGLALEADCRNVVADDIDLDGRPDLALLYEDRASADSPGTGRFGLMVFRNELATTHHWLGVRLKAVAPADPFGAVITVETPAGPHVAAVVAGDSWRSQQAPVKLFGLGDDPRVDAVEVRWPDGTTTRLDRPGADRYVDVAPAPPASPAGRPSTW